MIVKLHKNARTTPAIRAQLAASNEPVAILAKRFNLAPNTVRKWQSRTDFNDRSHTAHNLQTTLNPAQEHIVIYLRKHLLLPLDDLLSCIASHDYELAGRLPLQRAREILTELKRQMAGEGESHG